MPGGGATLQAISLHLDADAHAIGDTNRAVFRQREGRLADIWIVVAVRSGDIAGQRNAWQRSEGEVGRAPHTRLQQAANPERNILLHTKAIDRQTLGIARKRAPALS